MKLISLLLAAVLALTTVSPAWANVDVYFRLKSGEEYAYKEVNGSTTKEQLAAQISEDLGEAAVRSLSEVYVVNAGAPSPFITMGQTTEIEPMTAEMKKEKAEGMPVWAQVGLTLVAVVAIGYLLRGKGGNGYNGNCMYSYQLAKDGSRCGGRAASVRPGGA